MTSTVPRSGPAHFSAVLDDAEPDTFARLRAVFGSPVPNPGYAGPAGS